MKSIYTTIPIHLCLYALKNRKCNHLMLYVYLKCNSSGHIKYSNEEFCYWAADLGKSERWVRNTIKWMIKNKWISVNTKRKSYRIVSYEQLKRNLNLGLSKLSAKFEPIDFSEMKGFCCSVAIKYALSKKRYFDKKRRSGFSMDNSSMNRNSKSKFFHSLPVAYLAKIINVSSTTAFNYKIIAEKSGGITVKKQLELFIKSESVNSAKMYLKYLKSTSDENNGCFRQKGKCLYLVCPDLIKTEIVFKLKRTKY